MKIRSMTGYAQVKSQYADAVQFTISLKAVNHRFLDLHLRMPSGTDALEMKLRRLFKEKLHRGHLEFTLAFDRTNGTAISLNRELVAGYVQAFRRASQELNIPGEPDLNAVLKIPGALNGSAEIVDEPELDSAILSATEQAIAKLNEMRAHEGEGIIRELSERMEHLAAATAEVESLRQVVQKAYFEKVHARMTELISSHADSERILQEAAMLAERGDIQEEIVRMKTHIDHFLGLLKAGEEVGKKLDFLLQEMNREANTMLSKTSGLAGEALKITELGLAMKAEIEKSREQVQNIE
jgi:uncharacterized protein (TIGR00255 family)